MIEGLARVLIVGGGIGGMAAAIALRRIGVHTVDLIDIDPEWKVYGAGITITGPTLRAFRDLGLLGQIGQQGYFSDGERYFLWNGTKIAESVGEPIEPGLPASGAIMRPLLHQIMSSRVRELGVNVHLGVSITAIEDRGDAVQTRFSNGTDARYDLVVAADGIYSPTRALLFADAIQPVYNGQMSWRVVAPRPAALDISEFYFGHQNIAGINPCAQDKVYAFILHAMPTPRRIPVAEQPAFLRDLLADFGGNIGDLRDGITDDSSIVQRPFEYALQPPPWHKGRVVLIGDAVHATTAHLASGAGAAVEDAIVLSEELGRAGGAIEAALTAYTARRYERCRYIVDTSVSIGQRQLDRAPPESIGRLMAEAMHALAKPI